ncbi:MULTISPECIES: hypothetical protein [Streptococcus]|uniref:Uncharacterized protein n=1 Tax=Streptococcus didelphis TaxID=102886 RepID=A0ABY9LG56_9STRE|nr:hypothetical protein [Streptococcus didelphis]WMB27863.1 hypothetical protein N1496_07375 [Streptococcus didelphis]
MYHLRISKYNTKDRNEQGHYLKDDWTSISDIGKIYNGVLLTPESYYEVESSYINVLREASNLLKVDSYKLVDLDINDLNNSDLDFDIREGMNLTLEQCDRISRLILREKLWARLISSHLEVNFGYDFYMYMSTNFKRDELKILVNKYNLFWEEGKSPYFGIENN